MLTVLARNRQEAILDAVRRVGSARVSELVEQLGVSDMTVRRDIAELARRGLVDRVHGGATRPGSSTEPGFAAKSTLRTAQKRAIGRLAASLVEPGAAVALSAGTTTVEVARQLRDVRGLTVVTNSPPVADLLHDPERTDRTVVLTGGTRTPSDALVGPVAVRSLRDLHVDRLFLGAHGLHPSAGVSTPNLAEGETGRALVASAASVVVVADSTKWGVVGLSTIAALEQVDVLVSDDDLPENARRELTGRVGRLLLAQVPGAAHHPQDPREHPRHEQEDEA